jgi:hypothetical protein
MRKKLSKAEFLARMAAGRAKAARSLSRNPQTPRARRQVAALKRASKVHGHSPGVTRQLIKWRAGGRASNEWLKRYKAAHGIYEPEANPRRRPPHGGMEHFTPRSSRRIPKESAEAIMLRALNAGRRAKRAKLPAAIKLLHAELKQLYGKGLAKEQIAALRDRRRYVEALEMLDDMEARLGVSGFVRGEVADALRERAENPRKRRAPARKKRRVNPATKGFVIHAQAPHGPLLSFDGERFSNNRSPRYFATQPEAVRLGSVLVNRLPAEARRLYRVWVQLDASRASRAINPSPRNPAAVEQAAQKFRDFTGHEPGKITRVKVRTPRAALAIGKLDGVLYSVVRDGKLERYKHEFRTKSRPLLAVSSDGSQLSVVGGRYEFTEAGIEDR